MYTFNRNNRQCIHEMQADANFTDFTETETYYLVNDELNIADVEYGDLVKFYLYNNEKETQKVYGIVMEAVSYEHTTFMVCKHFDELGNPFYLDYVYSAFLHAFVRLNRHGSFSDWNQITRIKKAHAPAGFVQYWMKNHVTTDNVTESPEPVYETNNENWEEIRPSIPPRKIAPNPYLESLISPKPHLAPGADGIFWR